MKIRNIIIAATVALAAVSCVSMDVVPLSQGNSATWYGTETELELATNEFYKMGYWNCLESAEQWSDNLTYRQQNRNPGSNGCVLDGTVNGQQWEVYNLWQQSYKLIVRTSSLIQFSSRALANGVSQATIDKYVAQARFARACKYMDLLFFFGDLPYVDGQLTIQEACNMGRMPKSEIKAKVYEDFDFAIANLPKEWSGNQRFTKGAALAMKSRFALYNHDYAIAADAAKKCMELGIYSLHSDYGNLFVQGTKQVPEKIFIIPRSIENNVTLDDWFVKNGRSRNAGGYCSYNPSWDLFAAYTCTDGKMIDESPLFNPQEPFKNRDPRCTATIVEFGTPHLGFIYDPSPAATQVMNLTTGKMQSNNDSRAVAQYCSYNGLLWKKGVDDSWLENGNKVATDFIIIRYAEVLLNYAEAMAEQGIVDETVLNAVNTVRARAYHTTAADTGNYPAITETDPAKFIKILRNERRVELAMESHRLQDLMRWDLALKALNGYNYIYLYPASETKTQLVDKGLWPWPSVPQIDEDGLADFSPWFEKGQVALGAQRIFPERQMLWPIPTHETDLCPVLAQNQNPGY